jgi:hypothetical protein
VLLAALVGVLPSSAVILQDIVFYTLPDLSHFYSNYPQLLHLLAPFHCLLLPYRTSCSMACLTTRTSTQSLSTWCSQEGRVGVLVLLQGATTPRLLRCFASLMHWH